MMKLKTPTEEQKVLMQENKMNPNHWKIYEETDKYIVFLSRGSRQRKVIRKEVANE